MFLPVCAHTFGVCVFLHQLYHDIIDLCSQCVLMCHLLKFAATVIPLPSWPWSWPLFLARHQRPLYLSLSETHTITCTQSEVGPKKTNVRPKAVQREHRPTKVTLRAERRRCHLCPTWKHSHINGARRKTNMATCLAGTTARAISSTRQHTCIVKGMMLREKFAGFAFWLWVSLWNLALQERLMNKIKMQAALFLSEFRG